MTHFATALPRTSRAWLHRFQSRFRFVSLVVSPVVSLGLACIALSNGGIGVLAQSPAAGPDTALHLAEDLIGKALFLRGFYAANDLSYDAQGRPASAKGQEKAEDWTLSAVDITKAQRHGPNQIQLEGVRAAIRYNADAHQFERHPHHDETIRIGIATAAGLEGPAEGRAFEVALAAIFSIGIDPALQRSTPEFWRHYFDRSLGWPKDTLTDVRIVTPGETGPDAPTPEQMKSFVSPVTEHRENAKFTALAIRDRVNGEIDLRLVVDTDGIPHRISIERPIGYGLDARAVETVAKWRFHPATLEGVPVAATILIREQFDPPTPPHP